MQHYSSDFEDYEKKKKFFEDAYGNLTADELKKYNKIISSFRNRINIAWKLRKQIEEVEKQRESNDKSLKKTLIFFVALAIVATLIKLLRDYDASDLSSKIVSEIGFGFLMLTGIMFYLWLSLINKISNQNMTLNISNTNLAITILETSHTDYGLINFPNIDDYMKIYDNPYRNDKLSESELSIVNEFNVQLGLSALESMGYDVPLIWR
jgi:hypothetical protein